MHGKVISKGGGCFSQAADPRASFIFDGVAEVRKSLLCAFRNNVIISWFEKLSFAKTGSDQRKEREDKAVLNTRSLLCSHRVLEKGLVRKE